MYYRRAAFCCAFFGGLNAKDIRKEMFPVYGGKCLSCKAIHNWVEKSCEGRSKVADDARAGRPVEIATEAIVQRVEELIGADRKITIDSVVTALRCSRGLLCSIMQDRLKLRKVCAWWMPEELKDREKINRMGLSLPHRLQHADEGEGSDRGLSRGTVLFGGAEENHESIAYVLDEIRIEYLPNTGQKYYR
jgi:hypothetical protein